MSRHRQRQRQNTEDELYIVNVVNNHSENRNNILFRALYNKYYWNSIMCMLFFTQRLANIYFNEHTIYLYEWFNDPIVLLLSNNYIYKRIHWNNVQESYFSSNYKNAALLLFFTSVPVFCIINDFIITSFYISRHSLTNYSSIQTVLFYSIIFYTILNQCISLHTLYKKRYRFVLVQIMKYALIVLYINLYNILELLHIKYTVGIVINKETLIIPQEEPFEVEYHIHHWFYALCLIVLTELPEPYHTFLQYIHYTVYLHGISYYGYDTIIS